MNNPAYTAITVTTVHWWTPTLLSFTTTRPSQFKFIAGQFARIGFAGSAIMRPFSMVSGPMDDELEFIATIVEGGAFSALLATVKVGDALQLDPTAYGYLTLDRFQLPVASTLLMLATGTGVAPFLSMLKTFELWQRYERVVLVYSVRHAAELAYTDSVKSWVNAYQSMIGLHKTFDYLPLVTRNSDGTRQDRINLQINNDTLATAANLQWDAATQHIMLCGNPQMVADTTAALKAKNFVMNRRGVGNIAVENYW